MNNNLVDNFPNRVNSDDMSNKQYVDQVFLNELTNNISYNNSKLADRVETKTQKKLWKKSYVNQRYNHLKTLLNRETHFVDNSKSRGQTRKGHDYVYCEAETFC